MTDDMMPGCFPKADYRSNHVLSHLLRANQKRFTEKPGIYHDGTQTSDDRKSNLTEHEMTSANIQEDSSGTSTDDRQRKWIEYDKQKLPNRETSRMVCNAIRTVTYRRIGSSRQCFKGQPTTVCTPYDRPSTCASVLMTGRRKYHSLTHVECYTSERLQIILSFVRAPHHELFMRQKAVARQCLAVTVAVTKHVTYPVAQQIVYAIYALDLTESHFRFEAFKFMCIEGAYRSAHQGSTWAGGGK
ncbi:hypothetical protein CEK26_011900 [Fusarium fujikuroi]|uniref:Uncharacterized protein n=1 Tax=Fusarium fujikuroi TaxID=5127 RepID=A0A5Q3F1B6_FUSFU|nr:hypothetical protein CEK25_011906 [Fusarium fujikuroi]QGI98831.1 hypothetical protein CEK26_011900 [Fusarium fujikuroi]VTT61328.1 unnamed protein product [Fusarium fujikuroi]VTT78145.1 unnamed protein product [Fusarium fujikuroi]VZH90047.1 unnamed protein product [Fusarium fujikuroi]